MPLRALQNQHSAVLVSELKRRNIFFLFLFLIFGAYLQNDCLEFGKMQFNVQGVSVKVGIRVLNRRFFFKVDDIKIRRQAVSNL